ncbi:hypothetical protein [Rhizobium sp. C1]|uniref:hypothetical protein n=1 Tax=Rhizobium sp. C1 TaxID=1349799 RepID=UPI001E2D8EFC|nr:hypothetical protein [Rhizobium sp. C1]MCD2177528.1 hypothetical protein [Rhizobium sp. C1]
MEKQVRRMVIIVLMGVVFGLSTSAVVTSTSGSNVRFYHGPEVACVLTADPVCGFQK